jgi:hypothetical protein
VLAKFPPPTLDAAFLASLMRGMMAVLILAAAVRAVNGWLSGRLPKETGEAGAAAPERKKAA